VYETQNLWVSELAERISFLIYVITQNRCDYLKQLWLLKTVQNNTCLLQYSIESYIFTSALIVDHQKRWSMIWGLYYEAGFSLSRLNSGKSRAFRSYDAGSLFSRLDFHGNLCWAANLLRSRLGGRLRDQLSESTACWPIRAPCAEFKAINSYDRRRKEIQFKLPLQERRPAKINWLCEREN